MTSPSAKPQHFLIIGAQKCGTTWLHQQLASHPQILMPKAKDDEFFSYLPLKPLDLYQEKYRQAGTQRWWGDSCASYFWSPRDGDIQPQNFNPQIAASICDQLGQNTRFIVLLKDPVERTLSAYLHHIAHQSLAADVPILDAPDRLGLLALSRYGHHLRHWLDVVPAEQILVLPDPKGENIQYILEQSSRFLDLDPQHTFPQPERTIFPGLQRLRRNDGLWVALGQRGIEDVSKIQRPLPLMTHAGRDYVRLVHAAEINRIRQLLSDDTAFFMQQLKQNHIDTAAFTHWQTLAKT